MVEPTKEELALIDALGNIWNLYLDLPEEHPNEQQEFCFKLHELQRIIMSRSTRRYIKEIK